jgi:hypothetical protein
MVRGQGGMEADGQRRRREVTVQHRETIDMNLFAV